VVCDHLVAAQQIRDWQGEMKKHRDQQRLGELLQREEKRLAADRRKFHRWWSAARQARLRERWQTATS
jgi:hypothetical protein